MKKTRLTAAVRLARKNMRLWSRQWRIAKRERDRQGARFALERSLYWRNQTQN